MIIKLVRSRDYRDGPNWVLYCKKQPWGWERIICGTPEEILKELRPMFVAPLVFDTDNTTAEQIIEAVKAASP